MPPLALSPLMLHVPWKLTAAERHAHAQPEAAAEALRPFYRWGWVPLLAGCVFIAGTVLVASEVLLDTLGLGVQEPLMRWLFVLRAALVSGLLALWVGWYVLRTRQRLDAVREALRARELALAEQARYAEEVQGIGALARGLAHELRQPLNGLALHLVMLRRTAAGLGGEGRARVEGLAGVLEKETDALAELLDEYLQQGMPEGEALDKRPLDVGALVREVLGAQRQALADKCVVVDEALAVPLPEVRADAARLAQVLMHLVRHALGNARPGGRLRLEVCGEDEDLVIRVADDGPALEDPSVVFRPFFLTQAGGFALGLAIVRDVVRAHGGEVSAGRTPGGDNVITLRLPREDR